MEIHYQTSKKSQNDEEEKEGAAQKLTKNHDGRLDPVAIAALNKKVSEDPQV